MGQNPKMIQGNLIPCAIIKYWLTLFAIVIFISCNGYKEGYKTGRIVTLENKNAIHGIWEGELSDGGQFTVEGYFMDYRQMISLVDTLHYAFTRGDSVKVHYHQRREVAYVDSVWVNY